MVKPSRWLRLIHLGLACLGTLAGCSVVPRTQMEDCRKLSRSLQADNARLKGMILSQKTQYEDLAQRADDDARRLKSQDQEIQKLMTSIQGYQDEREQLARGVERLKSQIRSASRPISAQFRGRFDSFAKAEPGCEFDAQTSTVTIPTDLLFEPGTDKVKPKAHTLMAAFAKVFDDPDAADLRLHITGHTDDSPISRTSIQGDPPKPEHLSLDRANAVRGLLSTEGKIEAARIDVAGVATAQPRTVSPEDSLRSLNRRIEIRVSRSGSVSPEPVTGP